VAIFSGAADDSADLCKTMRPELEQSLRKAELGRYLIKAAEADTSFEEALEQGFQKGVTQERERQLAIDRAGGPDAFKAAELLASAIKRARKGR
jgi:hypothetical protein